MKIAFELDAELGAALLRFATKSGHREALAVLYAHLPEQLRQDQATQICSALCVLERALEAAGAESWPWVEVGLTGWTSPPLP